MSYTPETDAEAMDGIDCYGEPLKSWDYKSHKDGEVVPAEFSRKLERERDEARRERDEARRDLVGAEELHRRRFGTMKSEYDAACRKIERMKNRYAHARKLQRLKTSVMAGIIERYYYLLTSTLDALGSSLEILEPTVKRNMPILAMYIDNLKCKEMEIKEAIGSEASK